MTVANENSRGLSMRYVGRNERWQVYSRCLNLWTMEGTSMSASTSLISEDAYQYGEPFELATPVLGCVTMST